MLMPDTRPMLEVAWAPFLGAISIAFEDSDDESITSLRMDAFYYVIKVAAPQEMETVRDAFLTSLAKATHLHMPIGKMHQKRGEAFKTLLNVALQCGNPLHFMRMKFIFLFIFLLLLLTCADLSLKIFFRGGEKKKIKTKKRQRNRDV